MKRWFYSHVWHGMVSYFHDYDAIGWSVFADTAIFAARPNEKLQQATRFLNVRTFITFNGYCGKFISWVRTYIERFIEPPILKVLVESV